MTSQTRAAAMWVREPTAETAISPEAVWAVLRDLDQWLEITADFPAAMDGLLACAPA